MPVSMMADLPGLLNPEDSPAGSLAHLVSALPDHYTQQIRAWAVHGGRQHCEALKTCSRPQSQSLAWHRGPFYSSLAPPPP